MTQKQPKSALSRTLLDKLWEQCNWAHELWTLRRALIDGNRRKRTIERGPHCVFINTVGNALQESALLQITKLHDRAVIAGCVRLTLEYVVEYGGWDEATLRKLGRLKRRASVQSKVLTTDRIPVLRLQRIDCTLEVARLTDPVIPGYAY